MPERARILIVDDEQLNLKLLVDLLKDEYRPVVAKNGQQALARAQAHPPPELILLDIMMPEMDGYEVCERLKSQESTRHIPVIFVTAMNAVTDETRGFELGAVDYITKPISPPVVRSRVKTHLELSRARAALARQNASLRERLNFLSFVIHSVSQTGDLDSVLQTLLDGAVALVSAERGFVAYRGEQGRFEARFGHGFELEGLEPHSFEVLQSVLSTGRSSLMKQPLNGQPQVAASHTHNSVLAAPLTQDNDVVGMLYLDLSLKSDHEGFQNSDLELVAALSEQTSSALKNHALDRDRTRLHKFLERYVSPQVAEALVDNSDSPVLTAREMDVTILFADISGFTPLAERITPSELMEFLNEHFSLLVEVIYRHGGMVKQFAGDEVMAIFGAPSPTPDHVRCAVKAAVEMLAAFQSWQETWTENEHPKVGLKVGLHRGRVVMGSVGSAQRLEYAAVGDIVNTASRVMGLASHFELKTCVLATKEVVDECGDIVAARHLGKVPVKGRQTAVSVFELSELP